MADIRDWLAHWFPPLRQAPPTATQLPGSYSQMMGSDGKPLLDPRVEQLLQAKKDEMDKSLATTGADQAQSQALAEQEYQRRLNLQPSDLELFNMATRAKRR